MNIYENKSLLKLLIVTVAALIAAGSLWYTNLLVKNLEIREERLIDLYAKGLKTLVAENANDNLSFLFNEIIETNDFVPVLLTDENKVPINSKNINIPKKLSEEELKSFLINYMGELAAEHDPITVEIAPGMYNYIYYGNSQLLDQLRYYPYIQLGVIFSFAFLTYLMFNYSRNAEQNRVWAGLAKETAHQLGTPISSLMAWVELFKSDDHLQNHPALPELEKDIKRLETVTARFSNIGSQPVLRKEILSQVVLEMVTYLQKRISGKVVMSLQNTIEHERPLMLNKPLFEWVIENLIKNAVDATNGQGSIDILLQNDELGRYIIDIKDSGKGIPNNKKEKVFRAGYSTKQRGWGLGLTLAKRIITEYHKGQIFVKDSELHKGSTFRIVLLGG
jgi:two-component system, sporulation sensor kinase E